MTAVRSFDALSDRGRTLRLRSVALAALKSYDLDVARLSLAGESFNTVFRVDSVDGRSFALRVGASQRIHPHGSEIIESAWVNSIIEATNISVPTVFPNRHGEYMTTATATDVPGTRDCVLFDWAGGTLLRERLNLSRVRESGRILARLHEHAVGFGRESPPPTQVLIGDRVLYFRDVNLLAEGAERYGSLFTDARDRAQASIDTLWHDSPHEPHLLHGDYTWNNILASRNDLSIIDFQDLIWGFEVHDVAIALFLFDRVNAGAELSAAFRAGYVSQRPWPVQDRETFAGLIAARRLLQINLAFNLRKPGLGDYVDRHARKLRAWMDHGAAVETERRVDA